MNTHLEFGVELGKVSGFETEKFAQLAVQAQNGFERDGATKAIKYVRRQGGIGRRHVGPTAPASAGCVHR